MMLLFDRTSVVKPLNGAIHHQTFSVLINESAVSGRILNHVRLDGRQGLRELGETNLCIAIQVKPTHDRRQFLFDGLVTDSLEEASHCRFINDTMVLVINRFKRSSDAETPELLHVGFQLLCPQLKIDFFDQEKGKFSFNYWLKILVSLRSTRRSLCNIGPQVNIRAWQYDRHKANEKKGKS